MTIILKDLDKNGGLPSNTVFFRLSKTPPVYHYIKMQKYLHTCNNVLKQIINKKYSDLFLIQYLLLILSINFSN